MSDEHEHVTGARELLEEGRALADERGRFQHFAGSEGPQLRTLGGDPKPKRVRKPNLVKAIKDAAQAGLTVKGATIFADRVSLEFGQPEISEITRNPWDAAIYAQEQKRPS